MTIRVGLDLPQNNKKDWTWMFMIKLRNLMAERVGFSESLYC